jgi:cell division septal protein FtsQ
MKRLRTSGNRRIKPKQTLAQRWQATRLWWQGRKEAFWTGLSRRQEQATADHQADPDEEVVLSGTSWSRRLLWFSAVGSALLVLAVVLSMNDFLARERKGVVSRVIVVGNVRVPVAEVQSAGHSVYGQALMTLDRVAAAEAVEQIPWIRQATVEPQLPDAVVIRVREYEPYALQLSDGKLYIVDKEGYVFKEASADEAFDLPILTGMKVELSRQAHVQDAQPVGEEAVAATKKRVETAEARKKRQEAELQRTAQRQRLLDLLTLLQAHALSPLAERFPLSEVHWDPVLGTTLVSAKDGAEVRLGRQQERDLAAAFAAVLRLLDEVEARGEWLQYALLDDDVRADRAVVMAGPKERGRPAAPGAEPTPQVAPEAEGTPPAGATPDSAEPATPSEPDKQPEPAKQPQAAKQVGAAKQPVVARPASPVKPAGLLKGPVPNRQATAGKPKAAAQSKAAAKPMVAAKPVAPASPKISAKPVKPHTD